MPPASFVADGTHFFLTYPQCSLEREKLRDFLLGVEPGCKYYIARELHGDGNAHLHAYVHFGRRRRFSDARAFDVDGFHPNIQTPRSRKSVIAYISKSDVSPCTNIEAGETSEKYSWGDLLDAATDRDSFFVLVRQHFPRDLALNHDRLDAFCRAYYGRSRETYSGRRRDEFIEPVSVKDWVVSNLEEVNGPGGPQSPPFRLWVCILSCLYWLRQWSDRAHSYWLESLDGGRLSGRDLLSRSISTCADYLTSICGTKKPSSSSSTTLTSSSFLTGDPFLGASPTSPLPASTDLTDIFETDFPAYGSAMKTMTLEELFWELQREDGLI